MCLALTFPTTFVAAPAVKICGIMLPEHALAAAQGGAEMIGLVFAPSRRMLTVGAAQRITDALSKLESRPLIVGVFVNETTEGMLEIASAVELDVLQLSGDESPEQVAQCAAYMSVIKAVRFPENMPAKEILPSLQPYLAMPRVRLLLDTYRQGEYGGTGEVADWQLASDLAGEMPLILAGGLNPHNVGAAVAQVTPWGIDVSSGVEQDGTKSSALISEFLQAAHLAARKG